MLLLNVDCFLYLGWACVVSGCGGRVGWETLYEF